MKTYILATASVIGLLMIAEANAQNEGTAPNPSTEQQAAPEMNKPPMGEEQAAPSVKKPKGKKPCGIRRHKPRHHYRHHRGGYLPPANIIVPPPAPCAVTPPCGTTCDVCGCETQSYGPQYYWGNQAYPYRYYGGYFWYPHPRANMLAGYTPYYTYGSYWYASRLHPHNVYIERGNMVYVYPHPMDGSLYKRKTKPMKKKYRSAPQKQKAATY